MGYHTPGSQIFGIKIQITLQILTKIENILTHWSVDKAGSNDEKNWGSKISLDCPFKFSSFKNTSSACPELFRRKQLQIRFRNPDPNPCFIMDPAMIQIGSGSATLVVTVT